MPRKIYVMGEAAARQYSRNVREQERRPKGDPAPWAYGGRQPPASHVSVVDVRVTNTTAVNGTYKSEIVVFDSTNSTWSAPVANATHVWLRVEGGATPTINSVYPGVSGIALHPSDSNPVYGDRDSGGGGNTTAITVREQGGSPSYSSINTLDFGPANAVVLTNPATGRAQLVVSIANTTIPGIVSTTTQSFAGTKTFQNFVYMVSGFQSQATSSFVISNSTVATVSSSGVGISTGTAFTFILSSASGVAPLFRCSYSSTTTMELSGSGNGYFLVENGNSAFPNYRINHGGTVYSGSTGTIDVANTSSITVKGGIITSWS